MPTYTPEEIARNREALLQRTVNSRVSPALAQQDREGKSIEADRYRRFLMDQGEDPDSIGLSRLYTDRYGERKIDIPTMQEQDAANEAMALEQAAASRLNLAANRMRDRGQYDGQIQLQQLSQNAYPMSRNSQVNRRFWLDRIQGVSPYNQRFGNANGYSSY